jgi:hypothetical protein
MKRYWDYYRYTIPNPEDIPVLPDGLSLNESLAWLDENAQVGRMYTVTLSGDEAVEPKMLSYDGKPVSIALSGRVAELMVSLSSNGSLFTVGSGVELTLNSNVTLRGRSDNTASLVKVDTGSALMMNSGSNIAGNTYSVPGYRSYGGGVYVGEIRNNSASNYGGGVCVGGPGDDAMFIKQSGGAIYSNTAPIGNGRAVYINLKQKRDFDAGEGVTMDSTKSGSAGGWE